MKVMQKTNIDKPFTMKSVSLTLARSYMLIMNSISCVAVALCSPSFKLI